MKRKEVIQRIEEEQAELCPNCGHDRFHTEFHLCEDNFEKFCIKCGFVVFG